MEDDRSSSPQHRGDLPSSTVVVAMPASKAFYDAMTVRLAKEKDRRVIDALLDQWNICTYGATDYDSEKWGFNPDTWMKADRAMMESRIQALVDSSAL